ncbi:MAG: alpha/beta hydrolase [Rothia sp. (in: high G+C Gram-positive bacteria)]|nr:alpha/beta hydrolase [Rothia sp. (in: high G+C Gram-positive bacteria)]
MKQQVSSKEPIFEPVLKNYSSGSQKVLFWQGSRCRYWEYGNSQADPILLIHGFRGDHHGLELIGQGLKQYRVIIPDLPGFGKSEPFLQGKHSLEQYGQWLSNLISQLGIGGQVHLVGHSFGSIICSYAVQQNPDLVERMSLINPICRPPLTGIASSCVSLYYRCAALLPKKLGVPLLKSALLTRLTSQFMMKNSSPELINFINGQHAAYFSSFGSVQVLYEAFEASTKHTAAEFIGEVSQPVQMIVAAEDDLGSVPDQERMFSKVKTGCFDVLADVGHLIHYETPRQAASLINLFHGERS